VLEAPSPEPGPSDIWPLRAPPPLTPSSGLPLTGGPATTIDGRRAWEWALAAGSEDYLVAVAATVDLARRGWLRIGDPTGAQGLAGLDGGPPRLSLWRGASVWEDLAWQESDFVAALLPDDVPVEVRPHALAEGTRSLAASTAGSRPGRRRTREQRTARRRAGELRRTLDADQVPAALGHDRWTLTGYAWGLGLRPRWAGVPLAAGHWTTADIARRIEEAPRPR